MNARDLIRDFPWANKPSIVKFAGDFTRDQWKDMENRGVPALVTSTQLDPQYVIAFFTSIIIAQNQPTTAPLLQNGKLKFADLVSDLSKAIQMMAQQEGTAQPTDVLDWLGEELCERTENEMTSHNQMDNFAQCLSSENTRKILSGDAEAIAQAPFLPDSFSQIKGKDIRQLYRNREISFSQFEKCITDFAKKPQNQFPHWIVKKNNIELNTVASSFTQAQLTQLGQLLVESIRNETGLIVVFLRGLLMVSTNQSIEIKKCSETFFIEFVKTQQQRFLAMLISKKIPIDTIANRLGILDIEQPEVIDEVNVQSVDSELRQRKVADEVKDERSGEIDFPARRSSSSPLVANSAFGGDKLHRNMQIESNPNSTCCERMKKCVLL